jgi:formylglycine-generating enzyme required for sulfatase activity
MVRLDVLHRIMEREAQTNILFLDACRNNPLARNLARAMGTRSGEIGRGLATVESGSGTLISFSTQPGNVALDGTGRNSPFAAALVKHVSTSNDDLSALLISVRSEVMKETQRKQVPWEHSALTGRFYFNVTTNPIAAAPQSSAASSEWSRVDKSSVAELETFVRRHGSSVEAEYARARLADLEKRQVVVATPPSAPKHEPCDGIEVSMGATERRCLKPGAGNTNWFKDCLNCPEMVVVPAGSFTMGSPMDEPERTGEREEQVRVLIARPFGVGRFAVTRGEFAAFVATTGYKTDADAGCNIHTGSEWKQQADRNWRSPGFSQTDRHPVVCVNWNDAKAYVAWLSKTTYKTYRLLSETEREFVTRAGTTTPFWWGSTISTSQANYDGNNTYASGSKGEWRQATVSVDSFAANSWGLYNVHGNVWERVEDCWNEKNAGNPGDGSARTSGDCGSRVLRGGSWRNNPQTLRSGYRSGSPAVNRSIYNGLRVARTLE